MRGISWRPATAGSKNPKPAGSLAASFVAIMYSGRRFASKTAARSAARMEPPTIARGEIMQPSHGAAQPRKRRGPRPTPPRTQNGKATTTFTTGKRGPWKYIATISIKASLLSSPV